MEGKLCWNNVPLIKQKQQKPLLKPKGWFIMIDKKFELHTQAVIQAARHESKQKAETELESS